MQQTCRAWLDTSLLLCGGPEKCLHPSCRVIFQPIGLNTFSVCRRGSSHKSMLHLSYNTPRRTKQGDHQRVDQGGTVGGVCAGFGARLQVICRLQPSRIRMQVVVDNACLSCLMVADMNRTKTHDRSCCGVAKLKGDVCTWRLSEREGWRSGTLYRPTVSSCSPFLQRSNMNAQRKRVREEEPGPEKQTTAVTRQLGVFALQVEPRCAGQNHPENGCACVWCTACIDTSPPPPPVALSTPPMATPSNNHHHRFQ